MSDAINNLYVLNNNPFVFAEPLHAFYIELGAKPKGLLLSYFVLPLVLHPESHRFLKNAKTSSNLRTLSKKFKDGALWGVEKRIKSWSEETNTTLRHLLDTDLLQKSADLAIEARSCDGFGAIAPAGTVKAASNLGAIFKGHDVVSIFRDLGVKKLEL
jgi:hypothetical protein